MRNRTEEGEYGKGGGGGGGGGGGAGGGGGGGGGRRLVALKQRLEKPTPSIEVISQTRAGYHRSISVDAHHRSMCMECK